MPPIRSTSMPDFAGSPRGRSVRRWSLGRARARASSRVATAALAASVLLTGILVTGALVTAGGGAAAAQPGTWFGGLDGVAGFGNVVLGTGPATGSGAVVALAPTRDGNGYWLVRTDGTVTAEGSAHGFGSAPLMHAPIAGMAATPSGGGYWLAASDGGVFAFGDAPYLGSAAGRGLAAPIVAMAATPSGRGYLLVASDGGVFTYGDARYLGSAAGHGLVAPIVGAAMTPSGRGYWLVGADGGVFTYGDAPFLGSRAAQPLAAPITAIARTPSGRGYWLAGADGGVFTYGDAPYLGSVHTDPTLAPTTDIAGSSAGPGYWEVLSPASRRPLGSFLATCYTGGVSTATGIAPSSDVIAVDPGVIPLGSRVFIPGIGVRTAADTGGGIRGARVDVWEPTYGECVQFGAHPVDVFLLQ